MQNKSFRFQAYAAIILILVSWLCIYDSLAQVTFSKNWNPGKRTVDNADTRYKISANALCHFMMNQVRAMNSCHNPPDDIDSILDVPL